MDKSKSVGGIEKHKILLGFKIEIGHLIPSRRPDLLIIMKKKRTCDLEDFAVSVVHRMKIKANEKTENYLDLGWELRKLWIMRETRITKEAFQNRFQLYEEFWNHFEIVTVG